jgi:uncharacterized Zn-binding protein involved in type VI secretion
MPPAAARVGDMTKQDTPAHCHTAHGPAGPIPHPALPLKISGPGVSTVEIGGKTAAVQTDQTDACKLPGDPPAGPGIIMKGSMSVLIGMKPAARVGDMVSHPSCAAAIPPAPTGKILPPGCPTVIING